MKKLAIVAGAASLALTAAAFAGGPDVAPAAHAPAVQNNWYVGVNGGVAITANDSSLYRTGWNAGGQVGYKFNKSFRVEVAANYLSNHSRRLAAPLTGRIHQEIVLLMANGYYSLPLADNFSADVGAGVGYAHFSNRFTAPAVGPTAKRDEFAYQGIVGLNYHINHNMTVGVAYHAIGFTNNGGQWMNLVNGTFNYYFG